MFHVKHYNSFREHMSKFNFDHKSLKNIHIIYTHFLKFYVRHRITVDISGFAKILST